MEEDSKKQFDDAEAGQLAIDVYQTEKEIVVQSALAGVRPEDLDISIQDDMVSIKGFRHRDDTDENQNYIYQECFFGSFVRKIALPQDVDPEHSTASLKNGILTIRMPKVAKQKSHKVKIEL